MLSILDPPIHGISAIPQIIAGDPPPAEEPGFGDDPPPAEEPGFGDDPPPAEEPGFGDPEKGPARGPQ